MLPLKHYYYCYTWLISCKLSVALEWVLAHGKVFIIGKGRGGEKRWGATMWARGATLVAVTFILARVYWHPS